MPSTRPSVYTFKWTDGSPGPGCLSVSGVYERESARLKFGGVCRGRELGPDTVRGPWDSRLEVYRTGDGRVTGRRKDLSG